MKEKGKKNEGHHNVKYSLDTVLVSNFYELLIKHVYANIILLLATVSLSVGFGIF